MKQLPGLGLAALGAAAGFGLSWLLAQAGLRVPALTLCVLVGLALSFTPLARGAGADAGLTFAGKRLMRAGIVLLGLSVSFTQVVSLGLSMVSAVVALTVVAFAFTYVLARVVGMPGKQPLLMAAGFSICGASAIGAMGQSVRARQSEQGVPVALVTLFGTVAIVALPLAAAPLGVTGSDFGFWSGAAVHDVGQVVATASVAGGAALSVAVIVKLVRVLMLAPMVAVASLSTRGAGSRPPIVPLFIVGFLALVAARTWLPLPDAVLEWGALAHQVLLGVALVALLAKVRFAQFAGHGWRSVAVGAAASAFIALAALLVIGAV